MWFLLECVKPPYLKLSRESNVGYVRSKMGPLLIAGGARLPYWWLLPPGPLAILGGQEPLTSAEFQSQMAGCCTITVGYEK